MFKDIAGIGVVGTILVGFFVLFGGLPIMCLVGLVMLTGMAIGFGRKG